MSQKVTKDQYEFFRSLYDEEERTSLQLEGRAKVYLGIISAFLAALIVKADDAKHMASSLGVPWTFLLLEAFPMTIALVIVLWALRIREFEAVNDGPELIEGYGDDWPHDEQFYEDRVADYAVASSINRGLNNVTAGQLSVASWFMAGGIVYLLAIVLYAIWRA
jgi:hypothetical protein